MLKRCAYKFALKATPGQVQQLVRFAGSCRFVWNKMLAFQKEHLDTGERIVRYKKATLLLPKWKQEFPWLKTDAHSQALQQTLRDLDRALMDAFDKSSPKRFPRFKKKSQRSSFRMPQGAKLDQDGSRIYLPKIGWVKYRNSRQIEGTVKNVTVSLAAGRWYVSVQTEQEVAEPAHPAVTAVGIDMGIAQFAALSDGTVIAPRNSFRKHREALRKAQQALSRKVKFSSNWKKAKARVQKLHHRIANVRNDFLHKASTAISQSHAVVVLEDLKVANMSKSAAGAVGAPGHNVRQKSGLNRSILDQGWFEFRRQLAYKQKWRGGYVWFVPSRHTSQRCSRCGHTEAGNRISQSKFQCVACGHGGNADLNAAKNILFRMTRNEGQDTAGAPAGWEATARIACQVSGAARPPAAGTRRSAPALA